MRQIATIPSNQNQQARLFVDYLGSQGIEAKLESGDQGLELWICDEDQVQKAREEHEAFCKEPDDKRYAKGAEQSRGQRAQKAREEASLRKREEDLHNQIYHVPKRTWTLILIAASVIVTLMGEDSSMREGVYRNLFIAETIPQNNGYKYRPRADVADAFEEVSSGEIWRLVTPIFIHLSEYHLAGNMLWLLILGSMIETREGSRAFLLYVLILAVSGNIAQYVVSEVQRGTDWIPVLVQYRPGFGGFSGVIFGLFGFAWMKSIYQPSRGYSMSPFTIFLMLFWLYLCMTGLVGNIANTAHVMGLIVGLLLGYGSAWWQGIERNNSQVVEEG